MRPAVISRRGSLKKDEFDTGERMLLNFGHTIGHAIEKCCGFTTYTHGEGVGIGMVQMTRQTEKLGLTAAGTAEELSRVLKKVCFAGNCSI